MRPSSFPGRWWFYVILQTIYGTETFLVPQLTFMIAGQRQTSAIMMLNVENFHFFKDSIYLFLERGEGREKERKRKKLQCVIVSCAPPTGDLAHNPGMCPDWELNQQPFALQACTQSTELHQPGLCFFKLILLFPCNKVVEAQAEEEIDVYV